MFVRSLKKNIQKKHTKKTGSFDPVSSLWPRTAAEFAFSQDYGEGHSFLGRDRGLSALEAGLGRHGGARTTSLDEVRLEGGRGL